MNLSIFKKVFTKNRIEIIFLVLFFGLFLFGISGIVMGHSILHTKPTGYFAGDAFFHLAFTEALSSNTTLAYLPSYMTPGYQNVAISNPPAFYNLMISFSNLLGLEIYDSLILFVVLFYLLCILMMYVLIRKFDRRLAVLSLPLAYFFIYNYFVRALTWGQYLFVLGMFLFFGSIFALFSLDKKYFFLIFSLISVSLILVHPLEFFVLIPFILIYIIFRYLIWRKSEFSLYWKLGLSLGLAFLISFVYLLIFASGFLQQKAPHSFAPVYAGCCGFFTLWAFPTYVTIFIIFGIALSIHYLFTLVFRSKSWIRMPFNNSQEQSIIVLFAIYMLLITYTHFIGQDRALQIRLMWPILLMFFFGLTMKFFLENRFFKKFFQSETSLFIFSLFVIFVFFFSTYQYQRVQYTYSLIPEMMDSTGMITDPTWDAIGYIRTNVSSDAKILFLDEDFSQKWLLFLTERDTYVISSAASSNSSLNLSLVSTTEKFVIYPNIYLDTKLSYKKSLFSYGSYLDDGNYTVLSGSKICSFDYILSYRNSMTPNILATKILLADQVLEKNYFYPQYQNANVVLLKNENIQEQCNGS